jgi:hypothetical protein
MIGVLYLKEDIAIVIECFIKGDYFFEEASIIDTRP